MQVDQATTRPGGVRGARAAGGADEDPGTVGAEQVIGVLEAPPRRPSCGLSLAAAPGRRRQAAPPRPGSPRPPPGARPRPAAHPVLPVEQVVDRSAERQLKQAGYQSAGSLARSSEIGTASASLILTMSTTRLPRRGCRGVCRDVVGAVIVADSTWVPATKPCAAQVLGQPDDHRQVTVHLGVRDEGSAAPPGTRRTRRVGQHGQHLTQRRAAHRACVASSRSVPSLSPGRRLRRRSCRADRCRPRPALSHPGRVPIVAHLTLGRPRA